jgi:hypothetical protein
LDFPQKVTILAFGQKRTFWAKFANSSLASLPSKSLILLELANFYYIFYTSAKV